MVLVSSDGNLPGDHAYPSVPLEDRSDTTRSHVGSLSDFSGLHSSGTHGNGFSPPQGKENAGTGWPVEKNLTKSDSACDAASHWRLSAIRLRIPIHKLGWFTDVGPAACNFDPRSFFERGLTSLFTGF